MSPGLKLIQRALPVPDPARLLELLADAWQKQCPGWLQISLRLRDGLLSQEHTGQRLLPGTRNDQPPVWSATQAVDALSVPAPAELTVIPFHCAGAAVGGLLVSGPLPDNPALGELADVSARLIEQVRQLDPVRQHASPFPADDATEIDRRLRDLKLEAMAEFAAGAGHEINNPLATITGRAGLLLQKEADLERRRALETIGGQALRIRDMIGDAMTFARPPQPVPEAFSPAAEIEAVLKIHAAQFEQQATELITELDHALVLKADREQFRVVASCLIRNSLEALKSGGSVRVECRRSDNPGRVELRVTDTGPGLTEAEREHLFDPFYSGRPAGRGLGFGLAKCWRILQMHGGDIDAATPLNGGLRLRTSWPAPA